MAVTFKKKEPELSQRQQDALVAVGLSPNTQSKVTIKKRPTGFTEGAKVVVTNALFFWRKDYRPGDTGTVLKSWGAPDTQYTKRPRDDLYLVELDEERVEGKKQVVFSLWELDAVCQS